jgi:hypothetical protein
MECDESLLQVFVISVAVNASLKNADIVVDSFYGSAGDRMEVPVEQAVRCDYSVLAMV